jgi:carboxypeptidase A2
LEVGPLQNEEEVKVLMNLIDDDERIRQVVLLSDNVAKASPVSVAVSPEVIDRVQQILDENSIHFIITNNDLQATFDENMRDNEERLAKMATSFNEDPTTYAHDAYLRYSAQVSYIQGLAAAHSSASIFSIGTSYGGRTISGISINAGTTRPAVWIDSNIHAREWISSATVLYIIDQILTGTSSDAVFMRNNFRWYIVPNLNPDGYEYTWTNDRLWRKTRSPNTGSTCIGTDPNRNWDSNWCGEGASTSPCSDTYCGSRAFSERETAAARDYLTSIRSFTNVFLSIHCYSNLWLVPWGGRATKPTDYTELKRVGDLAAAAIRGVNVLSFQVGTPPDILYVASGGSFDWAKEKNNMKYAYSPELRPATQVQGGFDIPASNIIPSGREILAAVAAVVRNVQS